MSKQINIAEGPEDPVRRLTAELYLGRLLNSEYSNEQEALQAPEGSIFQLTANHYVVLSLSIDDLSANWFSASLDSFSSLRTTIFPVVEKTFYQFLDGIYENYFCIIDRAMSIVIWLQDEDLDRGPEQVYAQIKSRTESRLHLLKEQGIYVTAMLSRICDSIIKIGEAYNQIKELRQFKRIMGTTDSILEYDILDFSDTPPKGERNEADHIINLFQAIRRKDYYSARECLLECVDELFYTYQPMPRNIVTLYEYFVHLTFLTSMEIRKSIGYNPEIDNLLKPEKIVLGDFSVPEFRKNLADMFDVLLRMQEDDPGNDAPVWYQPLLRYIDMNYTDVTLNVSSLADQFSLNPSYLSNAFKRYSQYRLLDYINNLRVQKARALILTGVPVGQAATMSGFGSILTMRRAFVKFEGLLPSKL